MLRARPLLGHRVWVGDRAVPRCRGGQPRAEPPGCCLLVCSVPPAPEHPSEATKLVPARRRGPASGLSPGGAELGQSLPSVLCPRCF